MRYLLTTCSLLAFCGFLRAQFTTLTASADFVTSPSNTFGLDPDVTGNILQVRVIPNAIDSVGLINVLVCDSLSGSPLNMVSISYDQIQSGDPVESGAVVFNFPRFVTGVSYKLIVEAQNFQLGYLPTTTFYFRED